MQINFVDSEADAWLNDDGTAKNSKGGTELIKAGLEKHIDPDLLKHFKIIHSRVRPNFFEEGKKHILLLHDTWDDPESQWLKDENLRKRFEKIVFVSNYQMNTFQMAHGIRPSECAVMKNAIDPFPELDLMDKPTDRVNLIYHTTPHRGLEILVPVFKALVERHPNIHLDVFSSFKIYGRDQHDEAYKVLFDDIENHPNMTYHGTQSNETVREALSKAHIFAYPSIWPETSCISAIEALSAGCHILHPSFASLPETTGNFGLEYPWHENKDAHAQMVLEFLLFLIPAVQENSKDLQDKIVLQKVWADTFYNWDYRKSQWEGLLRHLLEN